MDRIFCIQKSWFDNTHFSDAALMEWVLRRWCPYYLDDWQIVDDDMPPVKEIEGCFAIPIGSIQFAQKWLADLGAVDPHMTPLEIPSSIRWLSGRPYYQCLGKEIPPAYLDTSTWFLKDVSDLKTWTSLLYDEMDISYYIEPEKRYSISAKMSLESEFRVFVLDGEILACQQYAGDPCSFPGEPSLGFIVDWYEQHQTYHPKAYSLDIATVEDGSHNRLLKTIPLEIHPFVSCGLYGFSGREIPDMLEAGYRWYLEEYVSDAPADPPPYIDLEKT